MAEIDPADFGGEALPQLDAADFAPKKPAGALKYVGQQALAGLTADVPTIAGKALEYASDPGKPVYNFGARMRAVGEANAAQAEPDDTRSLPTRIAAGAFRAAAPILPIAAAQFTPLGPAVDVAGAAALGAGFGGAQAQDTLEKARAAGLPEDQAISAARKTGAITGVGMGAVGALTGGAAAPLIRGVVGTGAKTAGEAIGEAATPSLVRPFIADTAGHLAANAGSMAAANAGVAAVEQGAGLQGPTPGEAALEGLKGGAEITGALLPFGLARSAIAQRANAAATARLQAGDADPQARAEVAARVHQNLSALDPQAAQNFADHAQAAIANRQPLDLGDHLLEPPAPDEYTPKPTGPISDALLALPAPIVHVDITGRARRDGEAAPAADEPPANVVGRAPVDMPPEAPPPLALPPPTVTVDAQGNARAPGQLPPAPEPGPRESGVFGRGRNADTFNSPAPKPGDILAAGDKPFTGAVQAVRAARSAGRDYAVAKVDGGYVVRPIQDVTDVQAKAVTQEAPVAERAPITDALEPSKAAPQVAPTEALAGDRINTQWRQFSPESGTLGVPRTDMPQIRSEHRGPLVNFLEARGISHENVEVPAGDLKPTQAEFSPSRVTLAKKFDGSDRSILVSSDNRILDGHHQWLAKLDANEPVKAIRLNAPIDKLIEQVKEFPSAEEATGPKAAAAEPSAAPAEVPAASSAPAESVAAGARAAGGAGARASADAALSSRVALPNDVGTDKPSAPVAAAVPEAVGSVSRAPGDHHGGVASSGSAVRRSAEGVREPGARSSEFAPADVQGLTQADILGPDNKPFRNRLAAGAALKKAGAGHEIAALAHGGFAIRSVPKADAAPAAAKPLSVGITPTQVEPVTAKDGVVHIGDKPAVNFETGQDVTVADGANHAQIKQALKDAGALSKRQKFFGGEVESAAAQPGEQFKARRAAKQSAAAEDGAEPGSSSQFRATPEEKAAPRPAEVAPEDASAALKREAVGKVVSEVTRSWLRKPEIKILDSMNDAPDGVRQQYESEAKQAESPSVVHGFHSKGTVYLVADTLHSRQDVVTTLLHESLGHFGLRGVFGKALNTVREEIIATRKFQVAAKAKAYGLDMAKAEDRHMAAEEVLAELAQTRPELSIVQKAIAAIRTWLRANVPGFADLALTDAEVIRNYILPARGFVERGTSGNATFTRGKTQFPQDANESPAPDRGGAQFSRGREVQVDGVWHPTENANGQPVHPTFEGQKNFWRWFKGSKVVNERGRPLVVYHGTGADFAAFDPKKVGSTHSADRRGFFFTANPEMAGWAADDAVNATGGAENIMPVYLSANKPLEVQVPDGYRGDAVSYLDEHKADILSRQRVGKRDSIIVRKGNDAAYVVFAPEQIKSATGNTGQFSPDDARVQFSKQATANPAAAAEPDRTVADRAAEAVGRIKQSDAAQHLGTAWDGLMRAVAPQYRTDAAREVSRQIIEGMGEREMHAIRFRAALNRAAAENDKALTVGQKARDLLEKGLTVQADKLFLRQTPEENHAFMQAMDTGDAKYFEAHPEMKGIADTIKAMFAEKAKEVQALGTGALQAVREAYFPHVWKKEPSADAKKQIYETLSKRPLEGKKEFAQQRTFDDIKAGLDAGFELVSNNPLDLVALKMVEMDRYILAHRTLKAMEGSDGVHLLPLGEKTPEGFTDINGRFGSIEREGQKLRYVAREDVGQVVNNFLSPSLYHNKYVGAPFTSYMKAANLLNQFQLGVFSAFHAGFTSLEAVISHASIGIKALTEGDFKSAGKYLGEAPAAWITNPRMGGKIIAEMLNKGAAPEMAQIVHGLELAGFKWQMDNRFRTDATKEMLTAWQEGRRTAAALKSIAALSEQSARPIVEWLVPRQKFGVFGEMYHAWMQKNPDATHQAMRDAAQEIWNRVDSRLGQVVYDRLFVHNTVKNFGQMLIRAPGWTGGTILEVGGGIKDLAGYAAALATGKKPNGISNRAAYTLSMMLTTAIANATLTALFTGDAPEDWRDLVAFRSGNLDEYGRPERFMLPTYMKDLLAYSHAPGKTLVDKAHPMLSLIGDIARNRDYQGTEIRSEDDNIFTQLAESAGFAAKQFVPFWIQGARKQVEREGSALATAAPLVGVVPAPADLNKTAAERLVSEYAGDKLPQGTRTAEEREKADLRRQVYLALRKGEPDRARELFDQGREAGLLAPHDLARIMRSSRNEPLVNSFKQLSYPQAVRVMAVADEHEQEELRIPFARKRAAYLRQHGSLPTED